MRQNENGILKRMYDCIDNTGRESCRVSKNSLFESIEAYMNFLASPTSFWTISLLSFSTTFSSVRWSLAVFACTIWSSSPKRWPSWSDHLWAVFFVGFAIALAEFSSASYLSLSCEFTIVNHKLSSKATQSKALFVHLLSCYAQFFLFILRFNKSFSDSKWKSFPFETSKVWNPNQLEQI